MKKMLFKMSATLFFMLTVIASLLFGVSAEETGCYEKSLSALKATYTYLNEMYVNNNPDFALALDFGSPVDFEAIKTQAEKITSDCTSDSQKAEAAVKWIKANIKIEETAHNEYSADVLVNGKGGEGGIVYLMRDMMRSAGIKSVVIRSYTGDMTKKSQKELCANYTYPENLSVFAHIDGKWTMYDLQNESYGVTDAELIAKNVYVASVEGVIPYYEGIDYALHQYNCAAVQIDSKMWMFTEKGPDYTGNYSGQTVFPGGHYYHTDTKRQDADGIHDGIEYTETPERRETMAVGQCYYDGWAKYDKYLYRYYNPNGIANGVTVINRNGVYIYDEQYVLINEIDEYFLKEGCLVVYDGEKLPFAFINGDEIVAEDKGISYTVCDYTFDHMENAVAEITADGRISVEKDGFLRLDVVVKNAEDGKNSEGIIDLYVTKTADYAHCEYGRHIYKTVSAERDVLTNNYTVIKHCVGCTQKKKIVTDPTQKFVLFSEKFESAPKSMTTVKATQTADSITLKWGKIKGATGYEIYQYNTKTKKYKKIKTVKASVTKYKIKKLKAGKSYKFKVKAFAKKDGRLRWSKTSKVLNTATKPARAVIKSLKTAKTKTAAVAWTPVSGANGYQVKYSTSKKFTEKTTKSVTVKKQKSKKVTLKKLKKGKKYYIKLRAYKTVNGKRIYGAYSKIKSVKVK